MPGQKRSGGREKGSGPGRGKGGGMNTSGLCVCPQCGKQVDHERGTPCYEKKCPACGAAMTRGGA